MTGFYPTKATIVYKFQSQAALLTEEICTAATLYQKFEKKFTVYKKESVYTYSKISRKKELG